MTEPIIRLLSAEDLDSALSLSTAAGWNQRPEDWRMLHDLAPSASFAAAVDGRIVGTALGIDYGAFSWIAMMLVEPAWRGRGIGRALLEAAMSAVPADTPIRLDATPLGRPLYQAHGFEDEATLTRLMAGLPGGLTVARTSGGPHDVPRSDPADERLNTRPMTTADLPLVSALDRPVFDGDRRSVLEWALDLAPHYGHVCSRDSLLAGYCLGRRGRLSDEIGPVVAEGDDAARALLAAAMRAASDRPMIIDSFDAHTHFADWAQACGFQAQRPLFRMRRPPAGMPPVHSQPPSSLREFTILGPEFA